MPQLLQQRSDRRRRPPASSAGTAAANADPAGEQIPAGQLLRLRRPRGGFRPARPAPPAAAPRPAGATRQSPRAWRWLRSAPTPSVPTRKRSPLSPSTWIWMSERRQRVVALRHEILEGDRQPQAVRADQQLAVVERVAGAGFVQMMPQARPAPLDRNRRSSSLASLADVDERGGSASTCRSV